MRKHPALARVICAAICAASVSGCASATRRDATEELHIASDPPGATVSSTIIPNCGDAQCPMLDRAPRSFEPAQKEPIPGPSCITPCLMRVKRDDELLLTFKLHGYQSEIVTSGVRVAPGAAAPSNFSSGGATYEHFPNPIAVTLTQMPATAPLTKIR